MRSTGDHGEVQRRSFRVLEFPARRHRAAEMEREGEARRGARRLLHQTPRERFLRAIDMERHGFIRGAVAHLRALYREVEVRSDPCLAIGIRYFLASYLMLTERREEARLITEEGIILAWEHEASEELELLDGLARQLDDNQPALLS